MVRFHRLAISLFAAAYGGLALAGCYLMGGPVGQAQVRIRGHSLWEIQSTAEDVFYRHGFTVVAARGDRTVFERRGRPMDNLLYGDWGGDDTTTRVVVYFIEKGEDDYVVRSTSKVIRNANTLFEDGDTFPDILGSKYQGLLNKIKREIDE